MLSGKKAKHEHNPTEFAKSISTDEVFRDCSYCSQCSSLDTNTAVVEQENKQIFNFLFIQYPPAVS